MENGFSMKSHLFEKHLTWLFYVFLYVIMKRWQDVIKSFVLEMKFSSSYLPTNKSTILITLIYDAIMLSCLVNK